MHDLDRRSFLLASGGALAAWAIQPDLAALAAPVAGAPLVVGVVGIGRQGRAILAELQALPDVTIAAICDDDPGRLRAGQRRVADAKAYASHAEMLKGSPEIQAVLVATPTHLHRAVVLDAIAAGKHVWCEAPLAHTIEDARAIATAARGAKGVVAAGYLGRANPVYALARTFFLSDAVRTPIMLHAQHAEKTTWRVPAPDPAREQALNWRLDPAVSLGLAGELGAHQFDVFHWYLGRYPKRVRGGGAIRAHDDGRRVADTIRAELDFGEGLVLSYLATLGSSFQGRHEVLHGENATIKLAWSHGWMFKEADAPTQGWEVYANRQQFHDDEGITLIADATKLAAQGKLKEGVGLPHDSLHYGLADFAAACAAGGTPACTIEEGYRATVVAICAAQAVTQGVEVMITDDLLKVG